MQWEREKERERESFDADNARWEQMPDFQINCKDEELNEVNNCWAIRATQSLKRHISLTFSQTSYEESLLGGESENWDT